MITPDALGYLPETPAQTAGPFVHIGLIPSQAGFDIFENNLGTIALGAEINVDRIRIEGRIFDGTGAVIRDALVEIWQADSFGRFNHPADQAPGPRDAAFRGWGRTGTDFETGIWSFATIKPGRVARRHSEGRLAPHILVWLAARGINLGLLTRLYFEDEVAANAEDAVLRLIEQPERRKTLIARRVSGTAETTYVFDIHLQGTEETVFFDV